ncbi:hypothetical protein LguiB_008055 [Lonicera macranthoides]
MHNNMINGLIDDAVDHLVNNAGVTSVCEFEHAPDVTKFAPLMASKAAIISFYKTLRIELGSDIGITIVPPGLIESDMTQGKFLTKESRLELNQEMRDARPPSPVSPFMLLILCPN